jgi:hypothetical protein
VFWSNINPYGAFRLDMVRRLDLLLSALMPGPRPAADGTVRAVAD